MTFTNQSPSSVRGKVSKEPPPQSQVADKINKDKQARKDGQALRAGKSKTFNNRRRVNR